MGSDPKVSGVVLQRAKAAVKSVEDLAKLLGNQKALYGLKAEDIALLKENLFYTGELQMRCLSRLARPELVQSKRNGTTKAPAIKPAIKPKVKLKLVARPAPKAKPKAKPAAKPAAKPVAAPAAKPAPAPAAPKAEAKPVLLAPIQG